MIKRTIDLSFIERTFFSLTSRLHFDIIIEVEYADMAELADAYGSGPYESNFMQVQVLLSAPKSRYPKGYLFFYHTYKQKDNGT